MLCNASRFESRLLSPLPSPFLITAGAGVRSDPANKFPVLALDGSMSGRLDHGVIITQGGPS